MADSEFIIDTGKTRTEPIDYSWRNKPGAGCLGSIDCKECGCIMSAKGSHCFCMGIYTCPRCGYEDKGWMNNIRGFKDGSPIYDDPIDIDQETFEKIKIGFKAVDSHPTGVRMYTGPTGVRIYTGREDALRQLTVQAEELGLYDMTDNPMIKKDME